MKNPVMATTDNVGSKRKASYPEEQLTKALKRAKYTDDTQIAHNTTLDIYEEPQQIRKTGIICTIGPASDSVEVLTDLMKLGLDCVRLNFSHVRGNVTADGKFENYDYPAKILANGREAAAKLGKTVAFALDTKGPEIRTGNFVDDKEYVVEAGSTLTIFTDPAKKGEGNATQFWVDYTNMPAVVKPGDHIFVDDGLLDLEVTATDAGDLPNGVYGTVTVKAFNTAPISNHKGCNLPNVNVDLPALSAKDKNDLRWGVANGVDFIFASFIRKGQDIREIRDVLREAGDTKNKIKIIAKIENHEGVQKFNDVLAETDGVMVARGDLGIEIPPQKVFAAQKMMCSRCVLAGKPVVVATQMLDSMIKNPRPTRAEITDVANAVLDGADCVMLSGETAKGRYPQKSVEMMAAIALEAEATVQNKLLTKDITKTLGSNVKIEEAIAQSAVSMSERLSAAAIIVLTNTGNTSSLIAKYRPGCPVIAVTGVKQTARQMCLTYACFSALYDMTDGKPDRDVRVDLGVEKAKAMQLAGPGDFLIAVHADDKTLGFANMVRVVQVPE